MKKIILGLITAFSISSFAMTDIESNIDFINSGGFAAKVKFQIYQKSNLDTPVAVLENNQVRPGAYISFKSSLPQSADQYIVTYDVQAYLGNKCSGSAEMKKISTGMSEYGVLKLAATGTTLTITCSVIND